MKSSLKKKGSIIVVLFVFTLAVLYCKTSEKQSDIFVKRASVEVVQVETSEQTEKSTIAKAKFEIPDKITNRPEQIITHCGYTVSYNSKWKIPNWVAYQLTKEEVEGIISRGQHFKVDPLVKGASATTNDYRNSGWDRGHMAPAADMKWSQQAMDESFYLSNICPQNHNLNAGDWKFLEEQVRQWATQENEIYVVCGPIVTHVDSVIGAGKVVVPQAFFKAILIYNQNKAQAVAFKYLNQSGHRNLWSYAISIDEIEKIIGFNLFPNLPDSIELKVEKQYNYKQWAN